MIFSGLSPVICINAKETNWPYANKNDSIKVLSLQTNTSGAQNNTRLIIYYYGIIVLLYIKCSVKRTQNLQMFYLWLRTDIHLSVLYMLKTRTLLLSEM